MDQDCVGIDDSSGLEKVRPRFIACQSSRFWFFSFSISRSSFSISRSIRFSSKDVGRLEGLGYYWWSLIKASLSSSKRFFSRPWYEGWEGCWEEGRKSSSASFSYSLSVSLSGWIESFIRVLCRVGSWSSSRTLDDGGSRFCLAGAESVFKEKGFDGLRGVRITSPES